MNKRREEREDNREKGVKCETEERRCGREQKRKNKQETKRRRRKEKEN